MRHFSIICLCGILLTGCSSTRNEESYSSGNTLIDLYDGTVELPGGFTHTNGKGIDSFVGHFTLSDEKLVISYDIGINASVAALHPEGKILSSTNVTVNGLTAIIVTTQLNGVKHAIVSFPNGGPANFFAAIRNNSDLELVKKLSLSYRLKLK